MSTHTPGPWAQGNNDPFSFGRKQGNGTEPIGFVYGPAFAERSEYGQTALANARLIAAAPDLLEACQAMVEYQRLIDSDATTGLLEAYGKAFEGALAAVAKATGQKGGA